VEPRPRQELPVASRRHQRLPRVPRQGRALPTQGRPLSLSLLFRVRGGEGACKPFQSPFSLLHIYVTDEVEPKNEPASKASVGDYLDCLQYLFNTYFGIEASLGDILMYQQMIHSPRFFLPHSILRLTVLCLMGVVTEERALLCLVYSSYWPTPSSSTPIRSSALSHHRSTCSIGGSASLPLPQHRGTSSVIRHRHRPQEPLALALLRDHRAPPQSPILGGHRHH
jgi:hypothetical protein